MVRRAARLGNLRGKRKVGRKVSPRLLDYHEGLSSNQIEIILFELGLDHDKFWSWMYGQTCPIIVRYNAKGQEVKEIGTFEYDLFRWVENQKKGTPLIWD